MEDDTWLRVNVDVPMRVYTGGQNTPTCISYHVKVYCFCFSAVCIQQHCFYPGYVKNKVQA